ncbi:MAG: hypothetical protein ACXWLK_10710, partial [Rhizomicrobium sp.]
ARASALFHRRRTRTDPCRPSPLAGKMRTYYDGISKDAHVAKGLREMQNVLVERQKAQAAAAKA